MNIFLKKVRINTLFSTVDPIKVEPLELEYLKTIIDELGFNAIIIDELFGINIKSLCIPDIIVLTGYNVAENQVLNEAKIFKKNFPNVKVIVGGVHIQLNSTWFHNDNIDFVIHSQDLESFRYILENFQNSNIKPNGFDYKYENKWIIGSKEIASNQEVVVPNRDLLYSIKNKTHYLEKRGVALVKGSVGCPYSCSYCYCKEINGGNYIKANYEKIVVQMSSIDTDYIWIVDDVFLSNREDAISFIDQAKKAKLHKKLLVYLRADFIINQKDLIHELIEVGLNEVIIGFEAINEEELKGYNKTTKAIDYPRVVEILKENNLDFTALFMVQPNYDFKDFYNLNNFIKKNNIDIFTLSIFTPMKGTLGYEIERNNLIKNDPKYFDFLHLVTKSKLPKWLFYILFYGMHIKLLKSKRIRKYLLQRKG